MMPQFELTYYSSQFFWTIVSFLLVVVGLHSLVIPAYKKILEKRVKHMERYLLDIHYLQEEMASLKNERKRHMDRMELELQEQFKQAHEEMNQEYRSFLLGLQRKQEEQMARFEKSLEKEKNKMIQDIQPFIEEASQELFEKFFQEGGK